MSMPVGTTVKDITNQQFGKLTAIKRLPNKNKKVYWLCQCECGNLVEVRKDHLKDGHVKSCGCLNHDRSLDLTNKKFGHLTAIKQTDKKGSNGAIYWECKCDCGNTTYVLSSFLKAHRVQSCGCINSIGELNIQTLLQENNIQFIKEYKFNDLKDKGFLRFDFAILENNKVKYLIEFDGELHTKEASNWAHNLAYYQNHDKIKNDYCKNHNIPLIRIPYNKRHTLSINDLLLETSKYRYI